MAYFSLIDIKIDNGIDESDIFTEDTLAKAIRAIAADGHPQVMAAALREIANALDHPKAAAQLKLVLPKRGGFESAAERDKRDDRETEIVGTVWIELNRTGRMKPAVYEAVVRHNVSRATVYKALRNRARIERIHRALDSGQIRHEQWEQWDDEQRAAYKQYRDWLYAFPRASPSRKP